VRAIDTNILVRLLTVDDERQAKEARKILSGGDVFIATTVVLETERILRAGYDFTSEAIAAGLRALDGLPGITLEEPGEVAQALDWLGEGMDFADALHLAKSSHCSAFMTFDRKLGRVDKRGFPNALGSDSRLLFGEQSWAVGTCWMRNGN
jgi:predicted nucleic-acid-binding protein